ncbi:MAG TPA: IPT/TIG domain-containing protein [Bryobacteraceae bacterium]|jgi:uncharacterized protein (TIGR03437 family)|nr:IPT/TIG domain-containing protein [Bryobacteraceae bacterium]
MRIQLFVLFVVMSCVAFAQPPSIANGGVLNGASFATGQPITVGSLVSIFGTNLASATAQADTIPLSNNLSGVTVQWANGSKTVNAPLVYVSATQVNAQVPWELVPPGATQNVSVTVTSDSGTSAPAQVTVGPFSPGIFATPSLLAIAQNVDGTLAQPAGSIPGLTTHPVKVGDAIIIYATGLGQVDFPPADGAIPPATVQSANGFVNTLNTPTVLVGGMQAQVLFSGLQPQFVGVNQVNIVIPPTAPTGNAVPLQIQMGGITSPSNVTIAVSQ